MEEEVVVKLREEQTRLIKIIEAFVELDKSRAWQTLKELIFKKSLGNIEDQLFAECLTPVLNEKEIYRLQGQRVWAKRYCEIDGYVSTLKKQLEEINKKLK